jgi:hypothetical protein
MSGGVIGGCRNIGIPLARHLWTSQEGPHGGKVNLFPGFSMSGVYTSDGCRELVRLAGGANMDRR